MKIEHIVKLLEILIEHEAGSSGSDYLTISFWKAFKNEIELSKQDFIDLCNHLYAMQGWDHDVMKEGDLE